jgi:LigT like Phosphoesterase
MASEGGSGGLTASSGGPRLARVFVALKMAPEIAGELARIARELERLPVRLIASADIHLTLVPPWNEVSIPDAVCKLRRVADSFGIFTLEFRHVTYGPEPRRPRLLWAECAAGPDLTRLHASFFSRSGKRTSGRFGRTSRWRGFAATEPSSRANIRSIGILLSHNASVRSNSCNRPLPANAATGFLRRCGSAQIRDLYRPCETVRRGGLRRSRINAPPLDRFHPPPFPRVRRQAQEPAASRQSPRPPDP